MKIIAIARTSFWYCLNVFISNLNGYLTACGICFSGSGSGTVSGVGGAGMGSCMSYS